jgi:hypothetical protein
VVIEVLTTIIVIITTTILMGKIWKRNRSIYGEGMVRLYTAIIRRLLSC